MAAWGWEEPWAKSTDSKCSHTWPGGALKRGVFLRKEETWKFLLAQIFPNNWNKALPFPRSYLASCFCHLAMYLWDLHIENFYDHFKGCLLTMVGIQVVKVSLELCLPPCQTEKRDLEGLTPGIKWFGLEVTYYSLASTTHMIPPMHKEPGR